jgi:DNA-binding SARP family transcriptional activator
MIGNVGLRRRITATFAAVPLVIGTALAWQVRPPLPLMPHSVSAPLPAGTLDATLHLLTWVLCVLLDLTLWWLVLAHGSRRELTPAQRRLQRAVHWPPHPHARSERSRWRLRYLLHSQPVMYLHVPSTAADPRSMSPPEQDSLPGDHDGPNDQKQEERPIEIRLLGPFELVAKRRPRRAATAELITYLVLHPAGASRDQLVEALYPGEDPQRATDRLFVVTPDARKVLGPAFDSSEGHYRLKHERLAIDLNQLDHLRARLSVTTNVEEKLSIVEQALALYRGAPLASIASVWAAGERHRLNAIWLDLLEQAGHLRLQTGRPEDAIAAAEQGILLDARNERFARLAMQAEAALGRRDAIIDRYEQLRRDLNDRYGLQPEQHTRWLYRELLSQDGARLDHDVARSRP